jgi:hypothetical protein
MLLKEATSALTWSCFSVWKCKKISLVMVAAAAKRAVSSSGGEFEADLPVPSFVFKAENLGCIVDADALV